ncbi:MAG: serine hydrolase, partial [Candidatus Sumerlaeia bacterium]|nr:serine hydrolase [Candidatus Sumerlaeia bacterium]
MPKDPFPSSNASSVRKATLLAASLFLATSVFAGTQHFTITDDATLNTAVANARTRFINSRQGKRLHATVLVKQQDGTWKRGSYEGTALSYPASSVKLPFMAAAMSKAAATGQHYAYLDNAVRPMIEVSDNVQTGVVVDAITGAPNTSTGVFADWMAKRRFTENFLNGRGLLGNQVIINKTYPSNSNLDQFELQAFNTYGSNQMQPNLSAELMLEIVTGKLEGGASAYMSQLLDHDAYGTQSALGWGLPAGSVYLNKAGWTSTVHNDIAYVRLPNGQELVVAAFSNATDTADAFPHDHSALGAFMDFFLQESGLDAGGPPTVRLDNTSAGFVTTGTWTTGTGDYDLYGTNYRYATGGTASTTAGWNLTLPQAGTYEVSLWWTDDSQRSSSAKVDVVHSGGTQTVAVDQRTKGGKWIYLGVWNFNTTGNSIRLNAGTSTSGRVIADAIKLSKVPNFNPVTIDNGTTGHQEVGTWGSSTGTGFFGTNSRFANNGNGSITSTWTPTLNGRQLCDVYAWWVASSNRSENAKYVVYHDGGVSTLEVAQDVLGGRWNYLGSFSMTNGSAK